MPDSVILNTSTTFTKVGSDISIYTEYVDPETGSIISVFIADETGSLLSVPYVEGEGVANISGSSLDIYLDPQTGNVYIDSDDANSYSIDPQTGQLQYTY